MTGTSNARGHATAERDDALARADRAVVMRSMTAYQLIEAGNMQADNDPFSMPLTPKDRGCYGWGCLSQL